MIHPPHHHLLNSGCRRENNKRQCGMCGETQKRERNLETCQNKSKNKPRAGEARDFLPVYSPNKEICFSFELPLLLCFFTSHPDNQTDPLLFIP